ncbi:MAG: DUF190 domain-containing protein [Deltaproteobacteria bacterium]|nr:DUF190 domain-containing protein [Deltaproteobacteria bacterium]MBF0523780.1 DUF190 domain-containing protein [Deltaproteobacteria bacterium]
MLKYNVIEIFTSEEIRWQGKPLAEVVIQHLCRLKPAARCIVTRGTDGCYENGEVVSQKLEALSFNLPVQIKIILPDRETDQVLTEVEKMVTDGIVAVRGLDVVSHKVGKHLIPRQLMIKEMMTLSPVKVTGSTSVDAVVRLLLSSYFSGLPVVDKDDRPVGIITQGDLIYRMGLPMRLGLLAKSDSEKIDALLNVLAHRRAEDAMTRPAVCIEETRLLAEAVELMLRRGLKRLPVVDAGGRLVGMVSRIDVFRTIMKESPDWSALSEQSLMVGNLRFISDIMRRDIHTVLPETSVEEVIRIIDTNDIQRVAVVDGQGRFLGLISDQDLLAVFSDHHPGIWDYFVKRIPFAERGSQHREFSRQLQAKTAVEVMKPDVITVLEDMPLDEAIKLMTEKGLKRLPVLDATGLFKGMISRDSVLRAGFGHP